MSQNEDLLELELSEEELHIIAGGATIPLESLGCDRCIFL